MSNSRIPCHPLHTLCLLSSAVLCYLPPSLLPSPGVQPCLGTNPLTWGIPTSDDFPFVLDCATSINQRGKIEKYARLGHDTPKVGAVHGSNISHSLTHSLTHCRMLVHCMTFVSDMYV
mgnify:CR=1 FL=1